MNTPKLFAVLGLVAAGFAVLSAADPPRRAPEQPPSPARAQPNPDPRMPRFIDCAKACDDCERVCNLCAAHSTKMVAGGKKEHLETLRTCIDCATICAAASSVTAKDGVFSDLICTACAEACKRCGDMCAKHAASDPIMKRCADECRHCEKVCRDMLKTSPKPDTPKPEK